MPPETNFRTKIVIGSHVLGIVSFILQYTIGTKNHLKVSVIGNIFLIWATISDILMQSSGNPIVPTNCIRQGSSVLKL